VTVFVCHSDIDDAWVTTLVGDLESGGEEVWLDRSVGGGSEWWDEILKQIRSRDVFVCALSDNWLDTETCRAEMSYANDLGLPVLPVQIGPLNPMRLIPFRIQMIDYREMLRGPRGPHSGMVLIAAVQALASRRKPLPDPLPPPPPIPGRSTSDSISATGIFISYRRGNDSYCAGRLYDHLRHHFGDDRVFMDVDSIDLGVDFTQVIDRKLSQCAVMLVVIGATWATVTGPEGQPRLQNPRDFVRLEVETALARDEVRVIPIYVEGAAPPVESQLPDALSALALRNGINISHEGFSSDFGRLLKSIQRVISPTTYPS
jgi:hypothetical protein